MKHILILSFSPIRSDPRVMRQIDALRGEYRLTVAGFGLTPYEDIEFHDVSAPATSFMKKALKALLLLCRLFNFYYWRMPYVQKAVSSLGRGRFDCVIANDVNTLPLALQLSAGCPLIFDAHEYSPREFEDSFFWRLFFSRYYEYLCRQYIPRASMMTTVCQGIADEYEKNFEVKASVTLNAPSYCELAPMPCGNGKIRMIHHGAAIRSRKLELMIEMMRYLDEHFTLDFMLVRNNELYYHELKSLALGDSRISFREPVDMKSISSVINEYDVGVFLLPPVNFNYEYALPNKFFEFIQARLAVAVGPSKEMKRITEESGIGVVARDFSAQAMAKELSALTQERIQSMKQASACLAREVNGEAVKQSILRSIRQLLAQS